MGTSMATYRFAKNGYIHLKKVIWFIAGALVGSTIGSNLTLLMNEKIVEYMMIAVLPIVAFYVLRNKRMGDDSQAGTIPAKKSFIILTGAAKYTIKEAAGTTKAINLSSNVAAIVTFIINGKVLYPLGLAAGLCSIVGNYIGSGLVLSNGQKIVRPVVLIVLTILFGKILLGG